MSQLEGRIAKMLPRSYCSFQENPRAHLNTVGGASKPVNSGKEKRREGRKEEEATLIA